jgi:isopentenyl-diphosphate Delta-isomerase
VDATSECLETFDDAGQPVGLVPRTKAHELGLWHRVAHVLLFRSDGRLILQRRHAGKNVWPGAWDLSAAEHLQPGESYLDGATRGLREELGVVGVPLSRVGEVTPARLEIPDRGIKDYELQQCFRGVWDGALFPDGDEVAATKVCSLEEIRRALRQSPDEFTPWFRGRVRDMGDFE